MEKRAFGIVALLGLFLMSLSSLADSKDKNVRGVKLMGKELKYNVSDVEIYANFQVGNKIIASDFDNYYCTELTDTELTKQEFLAKKGEGNNDFSSFTRFAKGQDNSILALSETGGVGVELKEMIVFPNSKNHADMANPLLWKRYDLSQLKGFHSNSHCFVSLPDSKILIAGTPKDDARHILSVIDYKKQVVIPLNYWPEDGIDVPDIVKSTVYTSYSDLYGNGKGRFIYRADKNRYSFIFSIDKDNNINVVKDLYKEYSNYTVEYGTNPRTLSRNTEELRIATNKDNIYVLLVDSDPEGHIYGKLPLEEYSLFIYGNSVELYDWDGNKKKILYLDHYGQRIMSSEDGKRLYLFSDDNRSRNPKEPHIWVYDISSLDSQPTVDVAEMEKAREIKYRNDMEYRSKTKPKTVKVDYIKEGDMMADFELYDYDNNPHHLNEFLGKGKYTILEFSSLGCGPCQMAKPTLEKFYKQYKDKFEMITISADRLPDWKKKPLGEVSWHDWNDFKYARDILKKYDVPGFPAFVIIDSEGKVLNECFGFNPFLEALKKYIPAEDVDKLKDDWENRLK